MRAGARIRAGAMYDALGQFQQTERIVSQTRMDARSAAAIDSSTSSKQFAGKRVHFIGIGGSGMSGLASMLLDDGAIVTGSEPKPGSTVFELTKRGAKISRDQLGELLHRNVDLVVRTAAVPDTNAEYLVAQRYGIPTIKYAQMLGEVMRERFGVAVAGTHGKSTTSAMISYALLKCGAHPSFVIGGTVPQLGGGSHSGKSNLFVAEACEYDRSFHNLHPRVAVITNIEEDHLDCYRNIYEIIEAFRRFAQIVPQDGVIISSAIDRNTAAALNGIDRRVESCALEQDAVWSTRNMSVGNGCYVGDVYHNDSQVCSIQLAVAGKHNLINATMAIAACNACGVPPQKAAEALSSFTGVDRRMTEVGRCNGAIVVDDYGHHPTEIRATLKALREKYQPQRLICIFQPHQHSRTRFLLEDFATSFAAADETIVPDIYFVRDSETEKQSVSAQDLVKKICSNGQRALHLAEFAQIVQHVRDTAREGDVIVTMGAGNVWEIGRQLVGG
jgi:UDP-N-acetylmuramate--alanine ligase